RIGGQVSVEAGADGGDTELAGDPPPVDLGDHRAAGRVDGEAGFGAAGGGFHRIRGGGPVRERAVGGGADVPAIVVVFFQPFPHFFFQLQPVPFRNTLLDPADQDSGGVDPLDTERL